MGGFEKDLKTHVDDVQHRLTHMHNQINEILKSQTAILQFLQTTAQTSSSPLLPSGSSAIIRNAINTEI